MSIGLLSTIFEIIQLWNYNGKTTLKENLNSFCDLGECDWFKFWTIGGFVLAIIIGLIIYFVKQDNANGAEKIAIYKEIMPKEDSEIIERICGSYDDDCWNRERAIMAGLLLTQRTATTYNGKTTSRRTYTDYHFNGAVVYTD